MSGSAIPQSHRRHVVFLLYDGVQLLDVAGAGEVFAVADDLADSGGYQLTYVAATEEPLTSSAGLVLTAEPLPGRRRPIDTLVVPGAPEAPLRRVRTHEPTLRWLEDAARGARRVVSVCSGAFLLGAIGLLDGRRATTHWAAVDRLADTLPMTTVEGEALFVQDGHVWTSAGVTTGIDLALALVSRDLGADLALSVARSLVLHVVRPGGQSQYAAPLALQARTDDDLERLIPWLEARLDQTTSVEAMASAMGMSERNFYRRCLTTYHRSPAKLLAELRLDRARALLRDPDTRVKVIATQTGFADTSSFTKAFTRRYGTSPASYRRAFASPRPEDPDDGP
jgi:transcriptional regulator GlxA family with amidase domain